MTCWSSMLRSAQVPLHLRFHSLLIFVLIDRHDLTRADLPPSFSVVSVELTFSALLNARAPSAHIPFAVLLVISVLCPCLDFICRRGYKPLSFSVISAVLTFNASLSSHAPCWQISLPACIGFDFCFVCYFIVADVHMRYPML